MRPLMLVLSIVLAIVSLLGVVWIFTTGMITLWPPSATVDGLFMSLILLSLFGCFLLNIYWEMKDQGLLPKKQATAPAAKTPTAKVS